MFLTWFAEISDFSWRYNSYSCGSGSDGQLLYPTISKVNHSCTANATTITNEAQGVVMDMRDIGITATVFVWFDCKKKCFDWFWPKTHVLNCRSFLCLTAVQRFCDTLPWVIELGIARHWAGPFCDNSPRTADSWFVFYPFLRVKRFSRAISLMWIWFGQFNSVAKLHLVQQKSEVVWQPGHNWIYPLGIQHSTGKQTFYRLFTF